MSVYLRLDTGKLFESKRAVESTVTARKMSTTLVFDLSVCVICQVRLDQAWHPHLETLESQPEIYLRKNSVRTVFIALIIA